MRRPTTWAVYHGIDSNAAPHVLTSRVNANRKSLGNRIGRLTSPSALGPSGVHSPVVSPATRYGRRGGPELAVQDLDPSEPDPMSLEDLGPARLVGRREAAGLVALEPDPAELGSLEEAHRAARVADPVARLGLLEVALVRVRDRQVEPDRGAVRLRRDSRDRQPDLARQHDLAAVGVERVARADDHLAIALLAGNRKTASDSWLVEAPVVLPAQLGPVGLEILEVAGGEELALEERGALAAPWAT